MIVKTAESKQAAIPELGRDAKSLYYVIIGEGDERVIMNVGEKTFKGVNELLKAEKPKK